MADAVDYQVFGLRVRSEIKLPELIAAKPEGSPDVSIRRSELPRGSAAPGLQPDGDALLLTIPDVARYRIRGGSEVVVDAEPGAHERNVRLFLLGSAFGALLHQRGLLPLHANAVEIEGRAVAFMGASGAGKSTLAAWFHDRGHRVLADDVCVVKFGADDRAYALPGLPRLRLWEEALQASGRDTGDFQRSYLGHADFNKYDVPVKANSTVRREVELQAAYVLEKGDEFTIDRLYGADAAEAVFAHTYRGGFIAAAKGTKRHWSSAVQLVRTTAIYRVRRPWGLQLLADHGARFVAHGRDHAPHEPGSGAP